MNRERTRLEQAAIAAHRAGLSWAEFWPTVAADVAQAEPWDLSRRSQLVRRLSLLVTAGDLDGERPAGDWWDDDGQAVVVPVTSDNATSARRLWSPAAEAGRAAP